MGMSTTRAASYPTKHSSLTAASSKELPLAASEAPLCTFTPPMGKYYVSGDWSYWEPEEMDADPNTPGLFTLTSKQPCAGGAFRIVRDADMSQTIYPRDDETQGPDDAPSTDYAWRLPGG